jgi:hypothetical protein
MAGRAGKLMRAQPGAVIIAAVLLVSGEVFAQSAPSNGPLKFLGDLFTGSKGNQTAPAQPDTAAQAAPADVKVLIVANRAVPGPPRQHRRAQPTGLARRGVPGPCATPLSRLAAIRSAPSRASTPKI